MFLPHEVLHMLNADALAPEEFESVMKRRREPSSVGKLMRQSTSARPEWELPDSLVRGARLRQLVDEWIATGFASDGGDSPQRRNLTRATEALAAVRECAATNPCKLHFLEKAAELVVVVGVPPASFGPNFTDRLWGPLTDADRIFTSMMTSEWRYTVCKCRRCGIYFIPSKLRRSYRHGTFCSREHQRDSSAAACTNERRTRAQKALIDFAAGWLLKRSKNHRWQEDKSLKVSLAAFISAEIALRPDLQVNQQEIRVNWVTRHASKIEKRRRELVTLR
jgi:hypothetical protein